MKIENIRKSQFNTIVLLGTVLSMEHANAGVMVTHVNSFQSAGIASQRNYDVNADGIADFYFATDPRNGSYPVPLGTYFYYFYNSQNLSAGGLDNNRITAGGPLQLNADIDGSSAFAATNGLADYNSSYYAYDCGSRSTCYTSPSVTFTGTWNHNADNIAGYLGFELTVGAEQFYGWSSLEMNPYGDLTVKDIAIESCAGVSIGAGKIVSNCVAAIDPPADVPEPSVLSLLALGAVGIMAMRKRKNQVSRQ